MNSRTSYVQGACDQPLIGATIGQMFDAMALEHAASEALVVPHQKLRWTYHELRRRVDDLASGLMRLGLEPGDRLGIWSPNCAEWVLTQFASAKAGLVLVNINPAYLGRELDYRAEQGRMQGADRGARLQGDRLPCDTPWPVATDGTRGDKRMAERLIAVAAQGDRLGSDRTPGMLNFDELARPADRADLNASPSAQRGCSSTTRSQHSSSRRARPARPRAPR